MVRGVLGDLFHQASNVSRRTRTIIQLWLARVNKGVVDMHHDNIGDDDFTLLARIWLWEIFLALEWWGG